MINNADYKLVANIPESIFRAYDIRGIVGDTFTTDNIYTIGFAIGKEALARNENSITVGRDGRLSGPALSEALQAGIIASGCSVTDIGMVTTPILYYATHALSSKSGVMLTGSHNPPEYNGIKIVLGGDALYGEGITRLYTRIVNGLNNAPGTSNSAARMARVERNITNDYLQRIANDIKLERPLKVVIDCGNGVGGLTAPRLFKTLGCTVIELFCDVDGKFPNHHPDPSVTKNLSYLVAAVKEHQADVGFAFDGDADRVGVVTDQGEIIAPDRLLMLFALDILTRLPLSIIPFDVKCTRHLADQIAKHGGQPLMMQTGHSLIKAKMPKVGAPIAGEFSGHIFFKERWYGFDDGLYAAARLAELLAKDAKKRSLNKIFAALPNSFTTEELKVPVAEEKKFKLMKEIVAKSQFGDEAKITTIDGLRADFKDGFGLVRVSNTAPYLVMRFEGDTEEALQKIMAKFKEQLLAVNSRLKIPF